MNEISSDYQTCSEEELMLLVKEGDKQAFSELYDRFHNSIYHYFLRIFNNDKMKAEDLLQDFFLKIYSNAKSFDPLYKFKNWAFTIAQNMCKNEFRKSRVFQAKTDLNENVPVSGLTEFDKQIDYERFFKELSGALEKLNFNQKSAFLLYYQNEFKIPEISRIQDCSIGTVKSRLFYACKKLSKLLSAFNPNLQEEKNE